MPLKISIQETNVFPHFEYLLVNSPRSIQGKLFTKKKLPIKQDQSITKNESKEWLLRYETVSTKRNCLHKKKRGELLPLNGIAFTKRNGFSCTN